MSLDSLTVTTKKNVDFKIKNDMVPPYLSFQLSQHDVEAASAQDPSSTFPKLQEELYDLCMLQFWKVKKKTMKRHNKV